jgi:hypothetical protein
MGSDGIPQFAEVYSAIRELFPPLFRALEHGCYKNREFHENEGENVFDPFVSPTLVRFFAKRALRQAGFAPVDIEMEQLSNNGLSLFFKGYHVRIRKGDNGSVPGPGQSDQLKKFYCQQTEMFEGSNGDMQITHLNLVVLWDFDELHNLAGLRLARPKGVSADGSDVNLHWIEQIPYPAEGLGPAVARPQTA